MTLPLEHLIPQAWFDGLPWAALLPIFAAALYALTKGADLLVDNIVAVAHRLGIPKIIVGATVVSLGTTSPEAAVSVMAAWQGQPGLALGNAVGSIIADTGLIFGIACLFSPIAADRFVLNRQGWVQFFSAVLLAAIAYGTAFFHGSAATLGRPVGLLLLGLLVAYLAVSVRWARQHPGTEPDLTVLPHVETPPEQKHAPLPLMIVLAAAGLVVIIFSSRVLVCSATTMAVRLGVPDAVIAGTLVAFGTSLPELATAISGIRKGHGDLVVGNVIGADILNVLFVVGASAVAAPLPIFDPHPASRLPEVLLVVHLPAMLTILLFFRILISLSVPKGRFSRWMGAPLLAMYFLYVVIGYGLTAGGAH